jgi:hypothetical protein
MAKEKEVDIAEDSGDFMAELAEATDRHIADNAPETDVPGGDDEVSPDQSVKKDAVPARDQDGDDEVADDQGDDEDDGETSPAVDDALTERAIRAGFTLAEVKAIADGATLARIVDRLLDAGEKPKDDVDSKGENEEAEIDALLANIPDLDPEEYPDELVSTFGAMKGAIKELLGEVKGLRSNGGPQVLWTDALIAGLSDGFLDVMGKDNYADLPSSGPQRAARDKLSRHIDFARQDAELSGDKITDAQAFETAVSTAFSDIVKSEKGKAVKAAASQRARQAVNRPRDTTGRFLVNDDNDSDDLRKSEAVSAISAMMTDD